MKLSVRIGVLLGGAALCAGAWQLMRFDFRIIAMLYIWPVALIDVARVISLAGSWMVTIPAVGLTFAILFRPGWVWLALRPMGMLALAEAVAEGGKHYLHRPRPETTAQIQDFWGFAMPSDHTVCAMAVWFSIAQVIGELWPDGRSLMVVMACMLGVLTGWSQVFLGVNWPADVILGWGIALLLIGAVPGPYPPQAGRVKAKR